MHKSRSIQLLASFSKDELKGFADFINSPYFNNNQRVARLFDELKKHHPEFTSKGILKERLYKKLFPGKAYNDQVMKNLNSELLKLERDFLSYDQFTGDKFARSISLITNLTARHVEPIFEKEIQTAENEARESDAFLSNMFMQLFRIEEEKFSNNIMNNRQAKGTGNINKAGEYLILFFLKNMLRLTVNNRINEFSFNADPKVNLLENFLGKMDLEGILKFMEDSGIEHTLNIRLLYYAMICNIKVDDDESYLAFKKLLFESNDKISGEEFQHLMHFLESIIAQKINSGRHEFYRDLFETYDYELKNNAYKMKNSPLTVMKFRNIYLSAIRADKFEWAENFINKYKNELHKNNRQSIVELSLAQLNFEKKDYEKTLAHLQKVRTSEIFYKVDVRNLNLMSLFELGHFESALAMIESYRRMLNTNESITDQYREKNINFINILGGLIRAKADDDKNGLIKLKLKLEQTESLANKRWLLKKFYKTSQTPS
jgi:hypothetical protein